MFSSKQRYLVRKSATGMTTACRNHGGARQCQVQVRLCRLRSAVLTITFRFSKFLHFFSMTVVADLNDSGTSRTWTFSVFTAVEVIDGMVRNLLLSSRLKGHNAVTYSSRRAMLLPLTFSGLFPFFLGSATISQCASRNFYVF